MMYTMQPVKKKTIALLLLLAICVLVYMSTFNVTMGNQLFDDMEQNLPFALSDGQNGTLFYRSSFTAIELYRGRLSEYRRILFKNNYMTDLLSKLYQNIFAFCSFYIMSILGQAIFIVFMEKMIYWTQNGDGKKRIIAYAL